MFEIDVSTTQARLILVGKHAVRFGLNPALVCAVVEKESNWVMWAIRFEPAFDEKYVKPEKHEITEEEARSISWGLMQIMGESARNLDFTGHLASLCDPEIGLEWGCSWLRHKIDLHRGDIHAGLQAWNGGGDPNYADDVLRRMTHYQL